MDHSLKMVGVNHSAASVFSQSLDPAAAAAGGGHQDMQFSVGWQGMAQPPVLLFYVMGIWSCVTGMTGILANCVAIALFTTSEKLRSPFNYLLLNLSVTELIISCTGNTILAINSFNRQWMFSYTACQANAFGMTYLGIQSIITLAVLALQRFMMVTQDRQFPLSTPISSTVTLIFIWLYTLACALPPLLGWGTFSVNTLKVSCGVKWKPGAQSPALQMSYIAFIYCLGFIIPIIIIFTSYIKIIKTIKNSGRNFPLSMSQSVRRGKLERDRRITRMVAIMLGSYLIIWFPYACTSIAEAAGYTPNSEGEYYLYALPTMLTKANVCVDPLIYFGFNPQFQHEMKRKLFSHREGSWGEMVSFNSFASNRRNKNSTVDDV